MLSQERISLVPVVAYDLAPSAKAEGGPFTGIALTVYTQDGPFSYNFEREASVHLAVDVVASFLMLAGEDTATRMATARHLIATVFEALAAIEQGGE